jgi:hypothetical protein
VVARKLLEALTKARFKAKTLGLRTENTEYKLSIHIVDPEDGE